MRSSISSSVPCRCADDRHVGRDPRGRLVQRREVVQVQHVGVGRAGGVERARPGVDVALVGGVVDGREDAVRRVGPVLVGRVHRRVAGGSKSTRAHVEARVEARGVAVAGHASR